MGSVHNVPLELICKRGRWKVLASASRYVQLGVALLAVVRLREPFVGRAGRLLASWPHYATR